MIIWFGRQGSIPGWVIPKTGGGVLDATLLKVWINGKVEQSRGNESHLHLYLDVVSNEKQDFGSPSTMATNGGARGVMAIVVGNGHGNTSSYSQPG